MKYIATTEDQTFTIEIRPNNQVVVNDESFAADFQSVAGQPIYSLLLDGQSYEALIYSGESPIQVLLRGQLFDVIVEDERQARLRQSTGGVQAQSGEYHLKAPMPGLIVSIPVTEGQDVKKGGNLIILESMKMQNELKAPRAGRISRLRVKPGDSVDQNQVLLTLI